METRSVPVVRPGPDRGDIDRVGRGRPPTCAAGEAPLLNIARYPNVVAGGAVTPEQAVRAANPGVGALLAAPWSAARGAPVWFTAGSDTFVATALPDGTWFASPARFVACKPYAEIYKR